MSVQRPGFALVEEEDVAFTLQLCREVHRIYGEYQDGELPSTDSMLAGLVVTVEMLAALSRMVRDGMPAMRITVAGAQTREMLTVGFGQDPMQQPVERRLRERYRLLVAGSAGAPGVGAQAAGSPCLEPPRRALAAPAPEDPASGDTAPAEALPGGGEPPPRSRLRRLLSPRAR